MGVVVAWFTSYVLTPAEPKWREAPRIPFELGAWFALFTSVTGAIVFAAAGAVRRLAGAHEGPALLPTVAFGAGFAMITLGTPDVLSRGIDAGAVFFQLLLASCLLLLPALSAVATIKRSDHP